MPVVLLLVITLALTAVADLLHPYSMQVSGAQECVYTLAQPGQNITLTWEVSYPYSH